jgi:hypothetical protein
MPARGFRLAGTEFTMNRFTVSRQISLAALVAAALALAPAPAAAGDRGCSGPAPVPAWAVGGGVALGSRDGYVFVQIGDRDGRRDARRDCGRPSWRHQPEMRSCQHRFRGSQCQACGFVYRKPDRCDRDYRDYRDRDRCDRDYQVRACCDRRDSHRHERDSDRDCRR